MIQKRRPRLAAFYLLLAASLALGGFSAAAQEPQEKDPPAEGELPAGHPPVASQLPTGHPPVITPADPSDALPPVPPGSGTGSAGLEWEAPPGWTAETPSSSMRRAQYRVPGAAGDGECVVYYFGPGQGGDAMANAERWAGQFAQPDGRSSTEVMKTERVEVNGVAVLTVEVTGTYSGGMAMMGRPPQPQADSMLLGAIAEGPDANWFFKLTGPEATLREQQGVFEKMVRSLRRPE